MAVDTLEAPRVDPRIFRAPFWNQFKQELIRAYYEIKKGGKFLSN